MKKSKKIKFNSGFYGPIRYNGKLIVWDDKYTSNVSQIILLSHVYRNNNFINGKSIHSCLYFGHWCWKDAFEHPLEAMRFLKRKII